ncbi:MAG TPA: hypothetical protein VGD69_15555 [Herpetosiphonaceae bacterium]
MSVQLFTMKRFCLVGSIGKIDNGVISLSSLWADDQVSYPLAVEPYTPAQHFARGKAGSQFRTKPQLALALVQQAVAANLPFRPSWLIVFMVSMRSSKRAFSTSSCRSSFVQQRG